MSTRVQCAHCRDILAVDEKLVGRTIRCPLCEAAVPVSPPDPERVFLEPDLAEQLEKFRLTDWDRACARKTLELGLAPAPGLRHAIHEIRRSARRGGGRALNEQLLADGAFDRKANLALVELIKSVLEKAPVELRECPNCFASVPAQAGSCRFCNQSFEDLLIHDMCPNCKKTQPVGREYCRHCKADMRTGLLPGTHQPRCPRCENVIRGDWLVCPRCRERLDRPAAAVAFEKRWRGLRDWWGRYSFGVLLLVLLSAALAAGTHWVEVKGFFIGRARAELGERLRGFGYALQYGDLPMLADYFAPGGEAPGERVRTFILSGKDTGWRVRSVETLRLRQIEMMPGEMEATVYAEIGGEYDPATVALADVGSAVDLDKAAQRLKTGHLLAAKVPWRWLRKDGRWIYGGPLPGPAATPTAKPKIDVDGLLEP